MRFKFAIALLLGAGVALSSGLAGATTIVDLTAGGTASGMISDGTHTVTFEFDQLQPSGTGVLNPFVRIQGNGTEQGYNTGGAANASQLPFDELFGAFTRDLQFSELESVGGEIQFVLDIGEPANDPASLLSLDGLKIFSTSTPGQITTDVGSFGTPLWDMDGDGMDNYVILDANADGNPGNGVSDMLMRVPDAVFAGVADGDYIILWSEFGLQGGDMAVDNIIIEGSTSAGSFEEWAHVTGASKPIPEPTSVALFGVGSLLVGGALRRKVGART